jgi:hypothetical protein
MTLFLTTLLTMSDLAILNRPHVKLADADAYTSARKVVKISSVGGIPELLVHNVPASRLALVRCGVGPVKNVVHARERTLAACRPHLVVYALIARLSRRTDWVTARRLGGGHRWFARGGWSGGGQSGLARGGWSGGGKSGLARGGWSGSGKSGLARGGWF